ncbi:zf-HC2 domain-containing protein [Streptomyces sp. NPDC050504]|uniref:zf-HC2 domain-containing protein n=1 Tax=Streptomyces sp. NPDC050504 TaxID=3365618 RepID=UPI0037B6CE9D
MSTQDEGAVHEAAGAYALGILDGAEAAAFEAHLADCEVCAAHLDEFAGMEPMLALLKGGPETTAPDRAPGPGPGRAPGPAPATVPTPVSLFEPGALGAADRLDRLVDEVAARRARRRRRTAYLVAAAVAVVLGGSGVAVVAASGDGDRRPAVAIDPHPTSPAEDAFHHHMKEKWSATDPATGVGAVVGVERKAWGTHAVLELKNVRGPLKCSLIAVSRSGEEETVSSWTVPKWGYGIEDSPKEAARSPLYVHGGAAMSLDDVARFEVRTFDGKRLVEVAA